MTTGHHATEQLEHVAVPNVVHYVVLRNCTISFPLYVSIKSVFQVHKPERVNVHSSCGQLSGRYFDILHQEFGNLITQSHVTEPKYIFGQRLNRASAVYHASDILRLRIILKHGGIYLDQDTIVLKPLDKYMKYEFTAAYMPRLAHPDRHNLDRSMVNALQMNIFLAKPGSRLIENLIDTYHTYNGSCYFCNLMVSAAKIADKHPSWLREVKGEFGSDVMVDYLYGENHTRQEWLSRLHAVHTAWRDNLGKGLDENTVKSFNCTIGGMIRYVLSGDKSLM